MYACICYFAHDFSDECMQTFILEAPKIFVIKLNLSVSHCGQVVPENTNSKGAVVHKRFNTDICFISVWNHESECSQSSVD